MGFLENSILTAKSVFDTTVKKAGDAIDVQKSKIEITKLQSQMNESYETLGKMYYDSVKGETPINEELGQQFIEAIDSLKCRIAAEQERMDDLRNTKTCPECGSVNVNGAKFCNNCGKELM